MSIVTSIAAVNASAAGDNLLVAAVPNKKITVRQFVLTNGAATANAVIFRSGTSPVSGTLYSPAALGLIAADRSMDGDYILQTTAGVALNLNLAAATPVGGYVLYTLD